jgi:uncharacterized NAD(P)/FAD-binding protein YdhS
MPGSIVAFPHDRLPRTDDTPRDFVTEAESQGAQPGCKIAVVGAGFSGVLVTLHLLWRCGRDDRIYLLERAPRFGQGLAYATGNPSHLLNMRIESMSALGDEPDHFARWFAALTESERAHAGAYTSAGTFVRRQLYGAYIQELLEDAITRLGGARNLHLIPDEATAIRPTGDAILLETAGGRPYPMDAAVLALGNFPPDQHDSPDYFGNPWDPQAIRDLMPDRPVLLIGTGHTMVDACLALMDQGFKGPIYALSRRGLVSHEHALTPPWEGLRLDADDRRSLSSLCGAVRREIRRAAAEGFDWRSVMDALRPHTRLLWQELSPADKRRFLRHLRPWWEIHRHRVAPPVAAAIDAARQGGGLRVLSGHLGAIRHDDAGLIVTWRPRGADNPRELRVQRVINCSGPETDYARLTDSLVVQLLESGLARPDPYRLGLHATDHGALIDRDGAAARQLFGVGPIVRGTLWEIISVADIRDQAEQVAIAALAAARKAASTPGADPSST